MPYIKKEDRKRLNKMADDLSKEIRSTGDLNYVVTRMVMNKVQEVGVSYSNMEAYYGTLGCIQSEFYRVVMAPYEDAKIIENGEVGHLEFDGTKWNLVVDTTE